MFALLALLLCVPAWADTVRVGLFVGANTGLGDDEPLVHAEDEARDLARVFQEMGDLSPQRSVVLQSPDAGELRETLRQVEAQVREISARGDDVMLVFYYSGHASRDGLHLAGTVLPMPEVRRWLELSAAQVRVAFVDACESGTLARVRGGTPVEAIELTVDDALTMSGLAIIASTGPLSVARESASFGGGVFSRALLTGLRGSADTDGDGVVTLDEVYVHAFAETVIGTAAGAQAVQKPEFRYEISGVGQVVLTRMPSRAAGLILPEEAEGIYSVVSVSNGQVVARVDKQPGEQRRLALPTGRYVVRKVRREDVLLAELDLVWGGDRWIEDAQMAQVGLGDPLARGGWSRRRLRLTLRGGASAPFVRGNPATWGGELEARGWLRPTLALHGFVGLQSGFRDEWSGRLRVDLLRLGLGLSFDRQLQHFDVSLGAGLEATGIQQRVSYLDLQNQSEGALTYLQLVPGLFAQGGLHLPVGPSVGLDLTVRGHLHSANVDAIPTFLVEGQALAGISFQLGRRAARASRR